MFRNSYYSIFSAFFYKGNSLWEINKFNFKIKIFKFKTLVLFLRYLSLILLSVLYLQLTYCPLNCNYIFCNSCHVCYLYQAYYTIYYANFKVPDNYFLLYSSPFNFSIFFNPPKTYLVLPF